MVVYKNGEKVEPDEHLALQIEGDEVILTLDAAEVEDAATYSVKVADVDVEVAPVLVKVASDVKVEADKSEVVADEGTVFELRWKITGKLPDKLKDFIYTVRK